ncbi:MAG: response regulator transcription factor [Sedimentisphaerales bacterium]|nr:response regulator transcription factor [Sedimentisphaerales bacterium]
MSVKILIADDHKIMREGLSSLIRKQSDMEVIGEAQDGQQAVDLTGALAPDVVIMDISMPGLDGIEATRRIKKNNPDIKIVVLSMYSNKRFLIDILQAGASSYLLKEQAFKELILAIHAVLNGELYLCSKMTSIVVQDFNERVVKAKKSALALLNEKEAEVLRLLAEGLSSKEIALQMKKSPKTIDAYRRQIMSKINVDNLADLVKYAIREGLISLDN